MVYSAARDICYAKDTLDLTGMSIDKVEKVMTIFGLKNTNSKQRAGTLSNSSLTNSPILDRLHSLPEGGVYLASFSSG